MTVDAGRRYQYRYFAAEDWQGHNDQHEYGFEPNQLAADNSVLDLTRPEAAQ